MSETGPSFEGPPSSGGTPPAPQPAREAPVRLPEVSDISSLGTTVRQLLTEQPPDIPEVEGSTQFWGAVSILRQPNITYGDMRIVPVASDAIATRQAFERKMYDETGKEIGSWTKQGYFIGPNRKLAVLSESVSLPASRESLTVQVGFNAANRISYVDLETTENYEPTAHTQVRYSYDSAGNVTGQELYSIRNVLHPQTGRPAHEYTRVDLPEPYTVLVGLETPPPTDYLDRPPSPPPPTPSPEPTPTEPNLPILPVPLGAADLSGPEIRAIADMPLHELLNTQARLAESSRATFKRLLENRAAEYERAIYDAENEYNPTLRAQGLASMERLEEEVGPDGGRELRTTAIKWQLVDRAARYRKGFASAHTPAQFSEQLGYVIEAAGNPTQPLADKTFDEQVAMAKLADMQDHARQKGWLEGNTGKAVAALTSGKAPAERPVSKSSVNPTPAPKTGLFGSLIRRLGF